VKCLFSKNGDINPIDEHLNKVPKILYKYRSFDPCGYSLKLASKGEVFFASAKDFNDPFDNYFIPKSELENLDGDSLDYILRKKAKQFYKDASDNFIEKMVEKGKRRLKEFQINKRPIMKQLLNKQYSSFGICSLSANPKSLPMWAYYGDSHKGLCIGIKTSTIAQHQRYLIKSNILLMLHKVFYTKKIPIVHFGINTNFDNDKEILKTLYTKSINWKHEEEYRLIFEKYFSKSYLFGTDAIAEVIIGNRANKKNIISLLKELKESNSNAVVKREICSESEYKIDFKIMKID